MSQTDHKQKHKDYLQRPFILKIPKSFMAGSNGGLMIKYGSWYEGLVNGELEFL